MTENDWPVLERRIAEECNGHLVFLLSMIDCFKEGKECAHDLVFLFLILKTHRQISKNDEACQFSVLQGTHWRSYLENPTIYGKFMNKFLYIKHVSKTCWEEKNIRTSKQLHLQNNCSITLKEYRSSYPKCFIKKLFLKN